MFNTVAQGLDLYKQQLKRYKVEVLDPIRQKFGSEINPMSLDDPYYTKVIEWTNRFQGMAFALGLTPEEILALDIEADIEGIV